MFLDVLTALTRSFGTLLRPRIWLYVLAPALIAFGLWVMLAWWELDIAVAWLQAQPPLSWIAGLGAEGLAMFFALTAVWLGILSLTYVSALLITAIFFLPLIVDSLAERDYPDVARLGKDSFVKSTTNSVTAALLLSPRSPAPTAIGWLIVSPAAVNFTSSSLVVIVNALRLNRGKAL